MIFINFLIIKTHHDLYRDYYDYLTTRRQIYWVWCLGGWFLPAALVESTT